MKLIRASFQNFRLLRDLHVDFSTNADKNLTVIRAQNETGKTTILNALQWGLYGDIALPGRGRDYRIFPIDWDPDKGSQVPISVTVEYETTWVRTTAQGMIESRTQYRIVRSVLEDIDPTKKRPEPTVELYELTSAGAEPISYPDTTIKEELPLALREVFFTDGDRALTFIEADVSQATKRQKVGAAIRSLLGLESIEKAEEHVKKAATTVNSQIKQFGGDLELKETTARIEEIVTTLETQQAALSEETEKFANLEENLREIEQKISTALEKGDKEELSRDINGTRADIGHIDNALADNFKHHLTLFRSPSLGIDLLEDVVHQAYAKLDELWDEGKIPNTSIPVLEERLLSEVCICGEPLTDDTTDGRQRRQHIHDLIDASNSADETQKIVTELYFAGKTLTKEPLSEYVNWKKQYAQVADIHDRLLERREENGRKLKGLEDQLQDIPNTDIQALRELRRNLFQARDTALRNQTTVQGQINSANKEQEFLIDKRDRILKDQEKGLAVLSEFEVIQDISRVLRNAYSRVTNEELTKVSQTMNSTFLAMIGADPEDGAIINRAEITKEFDLIVSGGPNDLPLDPDRDLNGASRRALTLAFILALTKVSEVEAPNVIDTPLGMTSDFVRRSILENTIKESSQLILFLTRAEIYGCEDLITKYAGTTYTLTNPSHYPIQLRNDPGVKEFCVLRCECDHLTSCDLCERTVA
jgi:DNA sulfur modification protein DndD